MNIKKYTPLNRYFFILITALCCWKNTHAQNVVPDDVERAALLSIYNSTNGANWNVGRRWTLSRINSYPDSALYGVEIHNGDITALNLSNTGLEGTLPEELNTLTELQYLYFSLNRLSGELPVLSSLQKLRSLDLFNHSLSGNIPSWLGELTSLEYLNLLGSPSTTMVGPIPAQISQLVKLRSLTLDRIDLSMPEAIPTSLSNLPNLQLLSLEYCKLTIASVSTGLTGLQNLSNLNLSGNRLLVDSQGTFPDILIDLPNLSLLYLSDIDFKKLPASFDELKVNTLYLNQNDYSDPNRLADIVDTLRNCTSLRSILLMNCQITSLPSNFSTLTTVQDVYLHSNPALQPSQCEVLGQMPELTNLYAFNCNLTDLPQSLVNCTTLRGLHVGFNKLYPLPSHIQNIPNLDALDLSYNGIINLPEWFGAGSMQKITFLRLHNNQIVLPLPDNFGNLSDLTFLTLSNNKMDGPLPSFFSNFTKIETLDISYNKLSSPFPDLSGWRNMRYIYMHHNNFTGTLPAFFSRPVGVRSIMDISFNHLDEFTPFATPFLLLSINNNEFDFTDILNQTPVSEYSYAPQDSVDIRRTIYSYKNKLTLSASIDRGTNPPCHYQWFKYVNGINDIPLISTPSADGHTHIIRNITPADEGARYYYKITNPLAPSLVLVSRLQTLIYSDIFVCQFTPTDEYTALRELYNATNGAEWSNNTGWRDAQANSQNVQGWFGVTLDSEGYVTHLNLTNNNLIGIIPASIGRFCRLQRLIVSDNQLSGSIPLEIEDLVNLQYLGLDHNQLGDSIPTGVGTLFNLTHLYLNNNQLTGSIPESLGGLVNLRSLAFSHNKLNKEIPLELMNLINLRELSLNHNQLIGSIPTSLENLTNLQVLQLQSNKFTGPIPEGIGTLVNLNYLALGENQLTGSIPLSLGQLINLTHLLLNQNQLSGSIPTSLGNLSVLIVLSLHQNLLTGNIPSELGQLVNLQRLSLGNNLLTGILPQSLSQLISLRDLYVDGNRLRGDIPSPITMLPQIQQIYINNNQFTFSNFLYIKENFNGTMGYNPQDSVDVTKDILAVPGKSVKLVASIDRTTSPLSYYQWFKYVDGRNDIPLSVQPASNQHTYILQSISWADIGSKYYYKITNPAAPLLTLTSRLQTLIESCPAPPVKINFVENAYLCAVNFSPSIEYFSSCTTESYQWDFGDGSPISFKKSPMHGYQNAGTYNVSLQLKYACGLCQGDTTIFRQVVVNPSTDLLIDTLIQITTDVKLQVVNSMAVTFSDVWPLQHQGTLASGNSFINGSQGVWRNDAAFAYDVARQRSAATNIEVDGTYSMEQFNWEQADLEAIPHWTRANTMTMYSPFSYELENRDVLGIYSAALYDYGGHLPSANGVNMRNAEMAFSSFEFLDGMASGNWIFGNQPLPAQSVYKIQTAKKFMAIVEVNVAKLQNVEVVDIVGSQLLFADRKTKKYIENVSIVCVQVHPQNPDWSIVVFDQALFDKTWKGSMIVKNQVEPLIIPQIDNTVAHTGKSSLRITAAQTFKQELLQLEEGKSYFISAWVSVNNPNAVTPTLANNLGIDVIVRNREGVMISTFTFQPVGRIIEGWQQVKGTFKSPIANPVIDLRFKPGSTGTAWYDDLRLHPEKGNMKSYVYDIQDYRLRAILDEENFASLFYYDAEGNLYLTKKETEEGIKTLTENVSYQVEYSEPDN